MHDTNLGDASRANSLEEHWMPFTGNREFKENPRLITQGAGVYYTDHKGGKVIDGSSALFCSPAGHGSSPPQSSQGIATSQLIRQQRADLL